MILKVKLENSWKILEKITDFRWFDERLTIAEYEKENGKVDFHNKNSKHKFLGWMKEKMLPIVEKDVVLYKSTSAVIFHEEQCSIHGYDFARIICAEQEVDYGNGHCSILLATNLPVYLLNDQGETIEKIN